MSKINLNLEKVLIESKMRKKLFIRFVFNWFEKFSPKKDLNSNNESNQLNCGFQVKIVLNIFFRL